MGDGITETILWRERILREQGAAAGTIKPRTRDFGAEWDGGKHVWPPPLWPNNPLWRRLPPKASSLSSSVPALPSAAQTQLAADHHVNVNPPSARSCKSTSTHDKSAVHTSGEASAHRWNWCLQRTSGACLTSLPVNTTKPMSATSGCQDGFKLGSRPSTSLSGSPWSTTHQFNQSNEHGASRFLELRSTNHRPINPAKLPVSGHLLPRGSGRRTLNPFLNDID
eukprot:gnl/MRDRNA2_/MRDRNA2_105746_c0_seq1.p1 gnl/MRDRNA2_/MRDRNA2_105746_c0~~gnl/MRDRNA2_/MRDRNA2_105746_c0_seq1.p1  ORF type:complete len:224 (+),score=23.78 gnl/MRDRNA2_/MRDRNA2_105746_c0_seq1:76-747(+)